MNNNRVHGEENLIQEFLAPLAVGFPSAYGLLDDCATLAPALGHELVVKTDPVAEGIHFLPDDAPEDIAWKALAVNVSDLAAKGAVPRAYLMALSFPEAPARDWMQRFAAGLRNAQDTFGMHLIGGDTDRRPGPLTISITVFGEVPAGGMVRRTTARPGDILFVSGTLGSASLGLALRKDPSRTKAWNLSADTLQVALQRYLHPRPRLALREALRSYASAAMDLSDGLAKDLERMCRASHCGARIEMTALPRDPVMKRAIEADAGRWQHVLAGGDDYEVLAAVPPDRAAAFEAAAGAAGGRERPAFGVTRIGEMTSGDHVLILDPGGLPYPLQTTGWDHF